jgi:hypothetical protein
MGGDATWWKNCPTISGFCIWSAMNGIVGKNILDPLQEVYVSCYIVYYYTEEMFLSNEN